MKVAFATQDKESVNAHFGWAKSIVVYDVSPPGISLLKALSLATSWKKTATKTSSPPSSKPSRTAPSSTWPPLVAPARHVSWP